MENDDFEDSLMVYMRQDKEIQTLMQQYMMQMQMAAQAQQMGGTM